MKKWQQIPPDELLLLNLRLHLWNIVWNRLNSSHTQNIPFRSKQKALNPKEIAGSQVLADTLSRQPTTLNVMESGETFQRIVIPPHTLFYEYPPRIEEAEIKPINENGEIVLSKVVVPEYIVVHDEPVNDSAAGNYYVRYKDYIKNAASSEIMPPGPTTPSAQIFWLSCLLL